MKRLLLLLFFLLPQLGFSDQQPAKNGLGGFIDLNGYYDTRDFNMFTVNLLANLPARFQYFSFINISSPLNATDNFELETFYSEQNLHWSINEKLPLDLTTQWVISSGPGNDLARFGFRWRADATPWLEDFLERIHLTYRLYFHLLQTDFDPSPGFGWQFEHVYRLNLFPDFLRDRLYLSGFLDHNINYGGTSGGDNHVFVTEHQLGIRLINWLYLVSEFRYNDFMTEKTGVGLGLEYIINF